MEVQRLFDLREVALLLEVGGVGDDPPPGLLPVHVVEVVPTTKNALRADRLNQRHRSDRQPATGSRRTGGCNGHPARIDQARLTVDHGSMSALNILAGPRRTRATFAPETDPVFTLAGAAPSPKRSGWSIRSRRCWPRTN